MPRLPILVLGLALLVGCGDEEPAGAPALKASLTGVPWQVTSGLDTPGWEAVAPTATFTDGQVSGWAGCNRYGAPYTIDGERLDIGRATATLMACGQTGDAVEAEYLKALEAVGTWRTDGDELVLGDRDGKELLRLRESSPTGSWTATAFLQGSGVSSPIPGSEVTAEFAADGKLTGSAGCNGYSAQYTRDGGALRITQPASTRKACEAPAGVMEQEAAYLDALPKTRSYEIDGPTLTLLTAQGTIVATYARAGG